MRVRSVGRFFMREKVLSASLVAAVLSMFLIPPDGLYLGYIDWDVLMLLFSLMAVVAGLKEVGAFDAVSRFLMARAGGMRRLAVLLTASCFFISMLVTNDVALISFVPLTVSMLAAVAPEACAYIVSLETVAANLGSMATPIGNPQNLYLFAHYDMPMGMFLAAVMPISALSLALLLIACLPVRRRGLHAVHRSRAEAVDARYLALYGALFLLCVLAVLRVIPKVACFAAVAVALLLAARRVFSRIDYSLLFTFVCFFVFVGNIARVPAVESALAAAVRGRELEAGILASQAISNVPAAIMLSGFTNDAFSLVRGVNIGGLGTLVASLASLISFRLYMRAPGARAGRYLAYFTGMNAAFLLILYGFARFAG
jgi:Na+/H+ antiporter NhaD/arsenite permease-like protein